MPKVSIKDMTVKEIIGYVTAIFGVIIPLWGGLAFGINYEKNLVKKSDLALLDLDARIERTEILVAVYARNPDTLTEMEKNAYERSKARLISLEQQRDELLDTD